VGALLGIGLRRRRSRIVRKRWQPAAGTGRVVNFKLATGRALIPSLPGQLPRGMQNVAAAW